MHTMHLMPSVVIQPNLELKTRRKQLLSSLLLVIALPALFHQHCISQKSAPALYTIKVYFLRRCCAGQIS